MFVVWFLLKLKSIGSTTVVELQVSEAGQVHLEADAVTLPQTILRWAVYFITEKEKITYCSCTFQCCKTEIKLSKGEICVANSIPTANYTFFLLVRRLKARPMER